MTRLDLYEQEQLNKLKYFWRDYGKYILAIIAVAAISYFVNLFWQYNNEKNSKEASILYIDSANSQDFNKLYNITLKLQKKYPKTIYASFASIKCAKSAVDNKNYSKAIELLNWTINNSQDKALASFANLRLATVYIDMHKFKDAEDTLGKTHTTEFDALYLETYGNLYVIKRDFNKARSSYKDAIKKANQNIALIQSIQLKLDAIGNN